MSAVHADERGEAPSDQPLRGRAGEAATECRATDQRQGAPRSRNRLRHRQPRADAGTAACSAASSDDGQHGNNRKRRRASWSGRKDQPSGGATEKPREATANRRSSPSCRGECGGAAQPQGDQLARRRKRCGLTENRDRAGLRGVPPRIAQQRSRECVAWASADAPKRL